MIVKAIEIQDATHKSVVADEVMVVAREIVHEFSDGNPEKFQRLAQLMFQYSATLAAVTATHVSFACLGAEVMDKIADEIREYDNLTQQIEKEMK